MLSITIILLRFTLASPWVFFVRIEFITAHFLDSENTEPSAIHLASTRKRTPLLIWLYGVKANATRRKMRGVLLNAIGLSSVAAAAGYRSRREWLSRHSFQDRLAVGPRVQSTSANKSALA